MDTTMVELTGEQRAHYEQRGYLILRGLLTADDVEPLLSEIDEAIDRHAKELHAQGELTELFAAAGRTRRLAHLTRQTTKIFEAVGSRSHRGEALLAMLAHPKIVALVASLMGPELMCHPAYVLRPKLPDLDATKHITVVPWHQDGAYFAADAGGGQLLTVWLALTESTVENGCLELVPGSHCQDTLPHRNITGEKFLNIPAESLPQEPPLRITAKPGDVVLFSQLMLHRALPNKTDEIRWSLDMRYHPAGTPTGFDKEPSFLVHSQARPEQVVRSWAQLDAVRAGHEAGRAPRWARWPMHDKI